jgi:conjugal transfer pilus assembly protein TraV
MRVLLLPYKGEGGELFMPRYVYFMADDPRWIMGGYLKEGVAD